MSEKTGRWEIAARISSGLPRIVVVVVPGGADAEAFSQELRADLRQLSDTVVHDVTVRTARDVEAAVANGEQALIQGRDLFSEAGWRALDRARSRRVPRASIAIVVDHATVMRMGRAAPNLASWLAGSVYVSDAQELTPDGDLQQRLAGLSKRYGMTGDEAIRRAESGDALATEPEFAVWLILLGGPDVVRWGGS